MKNLHFPRKVSKETLCVYKLYETLQQQTK